MRACEYVWAVSCEWVRSVPLIKFDYVKVIKFIHFKWHSDTEEAMVDANGRAGEQEWNEKEVNIRIVRVVLFNFN